MKSLTFIRHGESVANAGGVTMPHHIIPLSDLGRLQAQVVAANQLTPPSTILVSSMLRTHETAAPTCERFSLVPQVYSELDEFSVIDPDLIAGMYGPQRKPFVQSYWADADPQRRIGTHADTFEEFVARVIAFTRIMPDLPDATVIFGHGIWLGLLHWLLMGYGIQDGGDMRAFRKFQLSLPMPNCAAFQLNHVDGSRWSIHADMELMRRIALVNI